MLCNSSMMTGGEEFSFNLHKNDSMLSRILKYIIKSNEMSE